MQQQPIQVDNEQLAAVLRPACETIGVPVRMERLDVAHAAWQEFESFAQTQEPR